MSMSEAKAMNAYPVPITLAMIERGLRQAGLRAGDTALVHARLSAFGWIPGHAETVIQALLSVLGPGGTLIVPAFSGHLSDPSHWQNPPVPEAWWPVIRTEMPAFEPSLTVTRGVGALPEMVRKWHGASRSGHPQSSFAAIGPRAQSLLSGQELESEFGPGSPLERLVEAEGKVLFLGSDWDTATIFHLGEHRAGVCGLQRNGAPLLVEGQRRWVPFEKPEYDSGDFQECGAAFEAAHPISTAQIGAAQIRLFEARPAAEFAQDWLTRARRRGV
jgi:aminoglycoside 3-N-acetyltransferase